MPVREINHYLVYEVERAEASATVTLNSTFDGAEVEANVGGVVYFANPADKRHGNNRFRIEDEHAHLAWHEIECEPEPVRRLRGQTQFGNFRMELEQPVGLLVPAEKGEDGSQMSEEIGHYKVYVVGQCTEVEVSVDLRDQFFGFATQAHGAKYLGVPTAKTHGETEYPVDPDDPCLTFYAIDEHHPNEARPAVDQFGEYELEFKCSVFVGVPTRVGEWEEV